MSTKQILDFYASPGALTSSGKYAAQIKKLPDDISELARIVQGMVIHQFVAEPFYGVSIPDERKKESHIRRTEHMIDALLSVDDRALTMARPPEKRFAGLCRNFAMLLVAIFRAKGIPARSRYGFAAYFNPGFYEDHHVGEYWDDKEERWLLIDSQLDNVWMKRLHSKFNPLEVPRDQFLIAGDAWTQCRSGKADPSKFGTFNGNLYGLWFVAGSLIRDVAALNKMEMLQWDVWGAQPQPGEKLAEDQLAFFDKLAEITHAPGKSFDEFRKLYEKDDRLHVPPTVFNALLNRPETV